MDDVRALVQAEDPNSLLLSKLALKPASASRCELFLLLGTVTDKAIPSVHILSHSDN